MNIELRDSIGKLLLDTGRAHHKAFEVTDGADPYCSMVRSAIDRLGIDVELRDIFQDVQHRDDLVEVRGRATVPVLRVTSPDGESRWVPESRDIVSYLQETYG